MNLLLSTSNLSLVTSKHVLIKLENSWIKRNAGESHWVAVLMSRDECCFSTVDLPFMSFRPHYWRASWSTHWYARPWSVHIWFKIAVLTYQVLRLHGTTPRYTWIRLFLRPTSAFAELWRYIDVFIIIIIFIFYFFLIALVFNCPR